MVDTKNLKSLPYGSAGSSPAEATNLVIFSCFFIVFWNSAIEHNSIENMKKAVNVSLNALRKGGIFVSTWAFGTHTHWNEKASATILSETDAKHIFKSNWKIKPDFEKISNEYKENIFLLKEWHLKRFGNLTIDYVHAGNILVKK